MKLVEAVAATPKRQRAAAPHDASRFAWAAPTGSCIEIQSSMVEIFYDGFGAGMDVEFFVNVADVAVESAGANTEVFDNLFVAETLGELVQDVGFSWREPGEFLVRWLGLAEMLDHSTSNLRSHWRAARVGFTNGLEEFGRGGALEEVTTGASHQGLK